MYTTNKFNSDLMNSYAYDTAILFIQKCSNSNKYSQQVSLNVEFSPKGTKQDVVCNIYDLASNCYEWTTETSSSNSYPGVSRAGNYYYSEYPASRRNSISLDGSIDSLTFRPILYL